MAVSSIFHKEDLGSSLVNKQDCAPHPNKRNLTKGALLKLLALELYSMLEKIISAAFSTFLQETPLNPSSTLDWLFGRENIRENSVNCRPSN